ncbi:MAG: phosphatase PAP2 family protein [Gemmataceae bacterium]
MTLAAVAVASFVVQYGVKGLVDRPRPAVAWRLIALPNEPSFPSGHALSPTAIYLTAALLLARELRRRWMRVAVVAAGTIPRADDRPDAAVPGRSLPARHARRLDRRAGPGVRRRVAGGTRPAAYRRRSADRLDDRRVSDRVDDNYPFVRKRTPRSSRGGNELALRAA